MAASTTILCKATPEEDLEVRSTADDQEQQATEAKFNLQAEDACLSPGSNIKGLVAISSPSTNSCSMAFSAAAIKLRERTLERASGSFSERAVVIKQLLSSTIVRMDVVAICFDR